MHQFWLRRPIFAHVVLQLLKRNTFCFNKEKQNNKELDHHHDGAEQKWYSKAVAGASNNRRVNRCSNCTQSPMSEASQSKALTANLVWKNLTYINPNHRTLREGKKQNEERHPPGEHFNKSSGPSYIGAHGKRICRTPRADQQ